MGRASHACPLTRVADRVSTSGDPSSAIAEHRNSTGAAEVSTAGMAAHWVWVTATSCRQGWRLPRPSRAVSKRDCLCRAAGVSSSGVKAKG